MKKQRSTYDKEFKQMAINLCHSGKSSKEVAEELGVRRDMINRWKREYEARGESSFSGNGNERLSEEEAEISRLKKQLKDTQEERDILKKAVNIFSRSDGKNSNS
jgi:transposase